MRFEHQTKRLVLRVLSPDQADQVLQFYQRNRDFLAPYEPQRHPHFYSLSFQKSNLSYEYSSFLKSKYMRVWLFKKDAQQQPIGTVCFSNIRRAAFCSCVVGYKLDQACQQRGYMTEALSYLLPVVCREYQMRRIEAYVMPSNRSSIRLLEKLTFEREGLLHGYAKIMDTWQDHYLYTYHNFNG